MFWMNLLSCWIWQPDHVWGISAGSPSDAGGVRFVASALAHVRGHPCLGSCAGPVFSSRVASSSRSMKTVSVLDPRRTLKNLAALSTTSYIPLYLKDRGGRCPSFLKESILLSWWPARMWGFSGVLEKVAPRPTCLPGWNVSGVCPPGIPSGAGNWLPRWASWLGPGGKARSQRSGWSWASRAWHRMFGWGNRWQLRGWMLMPCAFPLLPSRPGKCWPPLRCPPSNECRTQDQQMWTNSGLNGQGMMRHPSPRKLVFLYFGQGHRVTGPVTGWVDTVLGLLAEFPVHPAPSFVPLLLPCPGLGQSLARS